MITFSFTVNTGGGTQIRTNHRALRRPVESNGEKQPVSGPEKK